MPIRTEHYLLESFLDGDSYLAVADKRRFSTVDNQLNRISEIIGDGRIEGWEVSPAVFPNITVSLGNGLINKYYVNTFNDQTFELSPSGTFYVYAQRRIGMVGSQGPKSDVASISYNDAGPPLAPDNFEATVLDANTVVLEWVDNVEPDMDHYDLEISTDGVNYSLVSQIDFPGTYYEDSVDEDQTYYYALYSVDQSGFRSIPASDSATTPLSTELPPNPIEVLMPQSEAAINVLWKRPPSIPFSKVTQWKITYVELDTDGSEKVWTEESFPIDKNLYNDRIDNLTIGQRYKVTLRTVDIKGRESTGVAMNITPQPTPAPRDPTDIVTTMLAAPSETAVSGVQVNLSWQAGESPYDLTASYRYTIYTTVSGQPESVGHNVPIGQTEEQIILYQIGTEYHHIPEQTLVTFRITAHDTAGFESFGNYTRMVTSLFSAATRLGNPQAEFDPDTGKILITWDVQPDTKQVLIVVVEDDLADEYFDSTEIIREQLDRVERYVFDADLNRRYTITLTPFNIEGISGPISTIVELTSIAGGLPTPEIPQDIEVKTNDRQVRLSWNKSPSAYAVYYNIYRMTGDIVLDYSYWTLIDTLPKEITVFTNYGLENDQVYSYYITALDVYGRESPHLKDDAFNLNFVEAIPKREGIITEPTDLEANLMGNNILLTWDTLLEEFDGFTVYRSIGNLHSWETIATLDRDILSYTDIELPLVDGTIFYYTVDKTTNDADIVVQTTDIAPENSIFLAKVIHGETDLTSISVTNRRDIADLLDPLAEYTSQYLLPHKHTGLYSGINADPTRIDLNPELIITDWTTVDGRIFTTDEDDITGTVYIVKVNNRFPSIFFQVDFVNRRLIFAEPIVEVDDDTGNVVGEVPDIEVRVLGVEEVQGVLPAFRFDEIHARQVQFGALNKEQLPDINHEGRILELLLPKIYLLERFSNHHFIVPQENADNTKTFGDGTTFYAVVASDGKIEEVIDFDLENDGEIVGFRDPAFSTTTVQHLKQNSPPQTPGTGNDNANRYISDPQNFTTMTQMASDMYRIDLSTKEELVASFGYSVENMTIDRNKGRVYVCSSTDEIMRIIDIATGELIRQIEYVNPDDHLDVPEAGYFVGAIEYNPDDGKLYGILRKAANSILIVFDDFFTSSEPVSFSAIGATPTLITDIRSMAYDSNNGEMYAYDAEPDNFVKIDLTNGTITDLATTLTGDLYVSMTFDETNNKMYAMERVTGDLYEANMLTGNTSFAVAKTVFAGLGWFDFIWMPEAHKLRIGRYPGMSSNVYLRFPVNVPIEETVSEAILQFHAHDTELSSGDNVNLRISYVDPEGFADAVDLSDDIIASIATLGSVDWSPTVWSLDENDSSTAVDVTNLLSAFVNRDDFTEGRHIILKVETLDSTTDGHHRVAHSFQDAAKAPTLEVKFVEDTLAEVNSNPGGFQSEKSYHLHWVFEDNGEERWVRITSYNAPVKPNPILDLNKRLRFRILNQFASIYLCFGIREITASDVEVGDDGGSTGTIEWVGIENTIFDDDGNSTPVGSRLIPVSNDWQEVDIDLKDEKVVSFENGNASLDADFGVLEHFAFTANPDDVNGAGPFDIYIDKLEQVSDVLVAGTSQGILLSEDFGTSWGLSRLTDTPVHKFYKATNNRFLWAISGSEVLLAVDPAYWFSTSGLAGVQYVRDIVEDNDGDMFVSTDKGVYRLEIAIIKTFASFTQTQPINAFTTDCYAMYHNPVSSGIDEIWVSTEIGIYKTLDKGASWIDSNLSTGGLVAYEIQNISTNPSIPNLIAINRKHVLRMLGQEHNFTIIANFEEQHDIFDIWTMGYFSGRLYISTGKGVFMNSMSSLFSLGIDDIAFVDVLPGLHFNNFTRIAFCLDPVSLGDFGEKLFIGQENRLVVVDEANVLSVKKEYLNKLLPSFFVDNVQVEIGYIYNAFNNVVVFREPQPVNQIVSAAHLPRKIFFAVEGGWSQTNPNADVFIYRNGIPTWLDFKYDEPEILSELQVVKGKMEDLPTLTSFNSLIPDSQTYKDYVLLDIKTITTGGEEDTALVNNATIVQFMDDYTRFLSLVTKSLRNTYNLTLPRIQRTGMRSEDRASGSRAYLLEEKENFEAENSTGITINLVTGEVDFLAAFSQSTTPADRAKYTFSKYDKMLITVFNANVQNTGEFIHHELEDNMENVNTGLTSNLAKTAYTDLMKLGIFIDNQQNFFMDIYNVHNIQSKYYGAHTNNWYDVLNSTIDYELLLKTYNEPEMRFVNVAVMFLSDPYFTGRIWIGTDKNIVQCSISSSGELITENILSPDSHNTSFIKDIFVYNGDEVYVVANDQRNKSHLYKTINFGYLWTKEEAFNLPDQIYSFRILNGVKVVLTEEGVFYCDNNFGTWYPADVVTSDVLGEESLSLPAFRERMFNMSLSTSLVVESNRWFYVSGSGIEFFSVGRLTNNDATVVNKIVVFKGLTWVATDRGLYHDANSLLSDSAQFTLQVGMEDTATTSAAIEVNDIVYGTNALYCCASNGKIYRCLDAGSGQQWLRYKVPDFDTIHHIVLEERSDKHYLLVNSYNQLRVVDVTPGSGVFG